MEPVEDMMQAFQDYYELKYSTKVAEEIREWFGAIRREYARAVYSEVVRIHERRYRSLPDIAVINKAVSNIPLPETMKEAREEIPDGRVQQLIEDYRDEGTGKTGMEMVREAAERERERVRKLVKRGEATDWEAWWIYTLDTYGEYRPKPDGWHYGDVPAESPLHKELREAGMLSKEHLTQWREARARLNRAAQKQ